ncbi:MAG TPA: FAD-dependent oxidoreductase [Kofleriaceae bacterium]|nr:FAD-dependent oxidoreductase [Kofleriaceae bacterium]
MLTLAAARARAGQPFRTSVTGEPRAPLCGMGVCHECRVTIEGDAHQLACVLPAKQATHATSPSQAVSRGVGAGLREERCDVLVIGGGPAGLAAARAAGGAGADVLLLDEHMALGGPIYRALERPWPAPPRVHRQTRVVAAIDGGVLAEDGAGALIARYREVIVAPGARELLLPFAGWTLPGVFGAGGLQLLAKGGWPVEGKRVVVGGTGPLLRAAAAGLRKLGARIVGIAELAPAGRIARFGVGLAAHPGKLAQAASLSAQLIGVPVWSRALIRRAHGEGSVTGATIDVGGRTRTVECDLIAAGFGLVPSIELPLMLGCAVAEARVVVDELGATSVPAVRCAGEATGIGGIDKALLEGEIAGLAAAGREPPARLLRKRRAALRFAEALAACFPAPRDWAGVVEDDTIVCRCEDVRWGALRDADDVRAAKLHTRAGMGACQGRVCGSALAVLRGFPHGTIRPPVAPVRLETLTMMR